MTLPIYNLIVVINKRQILNGLCAGSLSLLFVNLVHENFEIFDQLNLSLSANGGAVQDTNCPISLSGGTTTSLDMKIHLLCSS